MPLSLTDETLQLLRDYVREAKSTQSEIGKRERFTALLGTLFGGTREVGVYTKGAETSLRVTTPAGVKRGRADTVFGPAVIEFEKSLKQTLTEAMRAFLDNPEMMAYLAMIGPAPRRTQTIYLRCHRTVISCD